MDIPHVFSEYSYCKRVMEKALGLFRGGCMEFNREIIEQYNHGSEKGWLNGISLKKIEFRI